MIDYCAVPLWLRPIGEGLSLALCEWMEISVAQSLCIPCQLRVRKHGLLVAAWGRLTAPQKARAAKPSHSRLPQSRRLGDGVAVVPAAREGDAIRE
eukprot:SAG11_NODE_4643_length_1824_cov_1.106667_4_plen_95_part_01